MTEKKRKIIYLVTQSEWGGAQEYIYNLTVNLDKNQFEVLVLAGKGDGRLFDKLKSAGIPCQKLKHLKRAVSPLADFLALKELIAVYKKEKPEIIHLNSSKAGFLGSLAAKFSKSSLVTRHSSLVTRHSSLVIYTAHGWVFNEPLPSFTKKLYFWIEKISASWKNKIICVCESDRQIALKNNFKSKLITVHNAVDPESLNFFSKEEARQKIVKLFQNLELKINLKFKIQNLKLIGTIANLYPTKGIDFLIKAAAKLIKDHPELLFVIFGDGPEKENLKLKIENLKLTNNFFLLGKIPEAHQYLKAFDLFVLPSVKEGLPYAILKAIAAQIPVVATQTGGLPEILPAENLAATQDIVSLANKIKDALAGRLTLPTEPEDSFNDFLQKTIYLY